MTGMDDDQILAMMGVGAMSIGGDDAAGDAVVERESAEMFGQQNDWITLVFIRAKGT